MPLDAKPIVHRTINESAHTGRAGTGRMSASTVLIIEDEPEILELMTFTLERAGYQVIAVTSAEEALNKLNGPLPSLAIIDWMLPGLSGVDLARKLRQDDLTADMPLIMLTARGEESDKLRSFDSGIDDYVTKPFSPRELLARIKALLRRSGTPEDGVLQAAGIALDTQSHRLTIDGQEVHLGPTEFRLLEFLMRHPNRAFDRSQLLDRVWGRSVYVEDRTIDVHVLRLRKALKPFARDSLIQTVRGVGYRFTPS
jgi:two-component system, OmpR family, phosphate regulon response regulator PhoB